MKVTEVEWADSFVPLSSHFSLENSFCLWQQQPGRSHFWLLVIMWPDFEQKALTHNVFESHYMVVLVTVYWKITTFNDIKLPRQSALQAESSVRWWRIGHHGRLLVPAVIVQVRAAVNRLHIVSTVFKQTSVTLRAVWALFTLIPLFHQN